MRVVKIMVPSWVTARPLKSYWGPKHVLHLKVQVNPETWALNPESFRSRRFSFFAPNAKPCTPYKPYEPYKSKKP